MREVIFEKGKNFPHIVMFFSADCKALNSIMIVICDNFIGFSLIAEIVFIENDDFLFLTSFYDGIKLWIATAVGYPCISNLNKDINFMYIFLDNSKGFMHMSGKPVDMIFEMCYNFHKCQSQIIIFFRMNTPKYTMNMNRHTMHTNSVSPLRSGQKQSRYFSAEEVNKLIKGQFQPKLQFLMQQLEDRQQIIAKLNNKLNQNDEKLLQQSAVIQNFSKKHKDNTQWQSFVVGTVNQLINDKTKQCWETINGQLRVIGNKMESDLDTKRIENVIQHQMGKLKTSVGQFMDSNKKKSNSYWAKIKQALNKIYGKIAAAQKDIMDVNVKLQQFQHERAKDRETINQLQNSKHVVKNLIQLRKSVENIYSNYQAVLNLQKGFRQRIEEQGDSLWHQSQFLRTSTKIMPTNQDLMALEYSKEEGILGHSEKQFFEEWKPFSPMQQTLSPNKANDTNKSGSDIFPLQKTTPIKGQEPSELFSLNNSNQMNSKIHNSTVLLNHSLETRKEMSQGVRQRLVELIEAKNMIKPLEVRYDKEINYLKSTEGNYLFDMKGNMFKLTPTDLSKLEGEGLITRVKSNRLSLSKVKRTNC